MSTDKNYSKVLLKLHVSKLKKKKSNLLNLLFKSTVFDFTFRRREENEFNYHPKITLQSVRNTAEIYTYFCISHSQPGQTSKMTNLCEKS